MKLYGYFRSSASYRVRIALNLKGLAYESVPVHLTRGGGEQLKPEFRELNPQALVPVLQDGGRLLAQSLAIIEYLDEVHPQVPLLPKDPPGRARVRALAQAIACDLHPLNNLRVLNYLTGPMGLADGAKQAWYGHWIAEGLGALEAALAGNAETGSYCHGNTPGLADCCLVPQLANARRFKCDVSPYPTLLRIEKSCQALEAFQRAAPEKQPDAE
ncbi:MAG: maleylacetoacetate isomerase [Betaproteobacteria bacterium RIFCSPLOWO2_02_FULL_67_26]|nr:MAG: maleylacetoacetate isomerase [Betaproteobacteria bacterium RIFCSPLOWO2_02_FULL_67_26]